MMVRARTVSAARGLRATTLLLPALLLATLAAGPDREAAAREATPKPVAPRDHGLADRTNVLNATSAKARLTALARATSS